MRYFRHTIRKTHTFLCLTPVTAIRLFSASYTEYSRDGIRGVFLAKHTSGLDSAPDQRPDASCACIGVQGIVLEGGRIDATESIPELLEGSALIASHIPVELRAGAFRIQSLGGGYHITKSGNGITVAALTAPVLLTKGALRAVVPAGMQWKTMGESLPLWKEEQAWMDARAVRPLPKRFRDEQSQRLQTILIKNSLPKPECKFR